MTNRNSFTSCVYYLKRGELLFLDIIEKRCVHRTQVGTQPHESPGHLINLEVVPDDRQHTTYLLVSAHSWPVNDFCRCCVPAVDWLYYRLKTLQWSTAKLLDWLWWMTIIPIAYGILHWMSEKFTDCMVVTITILFWYSSWIFLHCESSIGRNILAFIQQYLTLMALKTIRYIH